VGLYEKRVETLIALQSIHDYEDILTILAYEITLSDGNVLHASNLTSPYRQMIYLAGLIISRTSYGITPITVEDKKNLFDLLNKIEKSYKLLLRNQEIKSLAQGMTPLQTLSAITTHVDYFFTSSVTYIEQDIDRIMGLFDPFNEELSDTVGYRVEQCVQLFFELASIRNKKIAILLKGSKIKSGLSEKGILKELLLAKDGISRVKDTLIFTKEELTDPALHRIVDDYSITKDDRTFFHYTENNPFESRPIVELDGNRYMVPFFKQLILAFESGLYNSISDKRKYFRNRDLSFERKLEIEIMSILGKNDFLLHTYFEERNKQYEHDFLLLIDDYILIVEAKARRIREPLRDPTRCYTRLRDDFRSDSGIQGAYDQAIRMYRKFEDNTEVKLYSESGEILKTLQIEKYSKVIPIVLTFENWGFIGVNPSSLIESYSGIQPWVCSLANFEAILMYTKTNNLTLRHLVRYIEWKILFQNKFYSTDELEPYGYFVKQKSPSNDDFSGLDFVIFSPTESDVIDDVYFANSGADKDSLFIT